MIKFASRDYVVVYNGRVKETSEVSYLARLERLAASERKSLIVIVSFDVLLVPFVYNLKEESR